MALDTKYRPLIYADVIGQEANVQVLKSIVKKKAGYHQSYVFCGPHGTGKTTLGRILARALLCDAPVDGSPCDECPSCKTILEHGNSECFIEVDAATNSGKDDIREIVEQLEYNVVSGKKRIYLFDEAHELSRQALDGLLKPMEDTVHGTEDKKLVCIFCTTEPEKMRKTIFSRCAPAFVVRSPTPQEITNRLKFVCEKEQIEYEEDALIAVSEHCECHVRDALKAVEGISMVGSVVMSEVHKYLRLDILNHCLDILLNLRKDFPKVLFSLDSISSVSSPSSCYEQLSGLAMMAFRYSLGIKKIPVYIQESRISEIATQGGSLLELVQNLLSPPHNPSFRMLTCDLAQYHHYQKLNTQIPVIKTSSQAVVADPIQKSSQSENTVQPKSVQCSVSTVVNGVYREPQAINKANTTSSKEDKELPSVERAGLSSSVLRSFILTRIKELEIEDDRSQRRKNLGSFGTFTSR